VPLHNFETLFLVSELLHLSPKSADAKVFEGFEKSLTNKTSPSSAPAGKYILFLHFYCAYKSLIPLTLVKLLSPSAVVIAVSMHFLYADKISHHNHNYNKKYLQNFAFAVAVSDPCRLEIPL